MKWKLTSCLSSSLLTNIPYPFVDNNDKYKEKKRIRARNVRTCDSGREPGDTTFSPRKRISPSERGWKAVNERKREREKVRRTRLEREAERKEKEKEEEAARLDSKKEQERRGDTTGKPICLVLRCAIKGSREFTVDIFRLAIIGIWPPSPPTSNRGFSPTDISRASV